MLKIKAVVFSILDQMPHSDFFIQAMRFGLFCAMAWSINSIVFSMVQLYKGEMVLETPEEVEAAARGLIDSALNSSL